MTSKLMHHLLIVMAMVASMTSSSAGSQQTTSSGSPATRVERAPSEPALPTIFIVGDSMVDSRSAAKQDGANSVPGWGPSLQRYFDDRAVNLVNAAQSGATIRSYVDEGHWDQVLQKLRGRDIVLIQFGQDDPPTNGVPLRGNLVSGHGTQARDNTAGLTPDAQQEHSYGSYLRLMIQQVKAHGAEPIVLAPIPENPWKEGHPNPHGDFWLRIRAVAFEQGNIDFVDLTGIMARELSRLGQAKVASFYSHDGEQLDASGASLAAGYVVSGLKSALDAPVSRYLSSLGAEVVPSDELAFKYPKEGTAPAVWILGDSTARNGDGTGVAGMWGWGDQLYEMMDGAALNISNVAVSGRSSRTYYATDWRYIRRLIRPGDIVLIQFGHNDLGDPTEKTRSRASLPGVGAETMAIYNPISREEELVHTYGWYLRQLIAEARQAGATPVICSPVPRNQWDGNKIRLAEPEQWSMEVARQEQVGFIDVGELIRRHYEELGRALTTNLFADGVTHSTLEGARFIANTVRQQLIELDLPPLQGRLSVNERKSGELR